MRWRCRGGTGIVSSVGGVVADAVLQHLRDGVFAVLQDGVVLFGCGGGEFLHHGSCDEGEHHHGHHAVPEVARIGFAEHSCLHFRFELLDETHEGWGSGHFAEEDLEKAVGVLVHFGKHEHGDIGAAEQQLEVFVHIAGDFLHGGARAGKQGVHFGQEVGKGLVEHAFKEGFFAAEVVVEQGFVDAGLVGDFLHTCPMKPYACEGASCCGQYLPRRFG